MPVKPGTRCSARACDDANGAASSTPALTRMIAKKPSCAPSAFRTKDELAGISLTSIEGMTEPQLRPAPSPRRGEGWGEGVTKDREIDPPSPPPSPRWGEGVPPCRDRSPHLPTSAVRFKLVFNIADTSHVEPHQRRGSSIT